MQKKEVSSTRGEISQRCIISQTPSLLIVSHQKRSSECLQELAKASYACSSLSLSHTEGPAANAPTPEDNHLQALLGKAESLIKQLEEAQEAVGQVFYYSEMICCAPKISFKKSRYYLICRPGYFSSEGPTYMRRYTYVEGSLHVCRKTMSFSIVLKGMPELFKAWRKLSDRAWRMHPRTEMRTRSGFPFLICRVCRFCRSCIMTSRMAQSTELAVQRKHIRRYPCDDSIVNFQNFFFSNKTATFCRASWPFCSGNG